MSLFDRDKLLNEYKARYEHKQSVFNSPVGNITSRDQIIDPYSLVLSSDYDNSRRGRARYEEDLARAIRLAEMQEAAYQEWFNSESQQAARQKIAGLNPDLLGVDGGSAADVAAPEGSPMDGIATDEQFVLQSAHSIASLVGSLASVASLATSFSQISMIKSQKDLLQNQAEGVALGNITQFEQLAHNAISDKLSKFVSAATAAGESVDIASFFANDDNFSDIIPSYAPSDDPRYVHALNRVRTGSQSILSKAYETSTLSGQNQRSFADVLSNPYYSADIKVQAAMLMPVAKAVEDLRLLGIDYQNTTTELKKRYAEGINLESAVESFNSSHDALATEGEYKQDYYNELNGQLQAKLEQFKLSSDSIIQSVSSQIQDNLFRMYKNNPLDYSSNAALFLLLSGASVGWKDFLAANAFNLANVVSLPSSSRPVLNPVARQSSDDPSVQSAIEAGYFLFGND